MNFEKIIYWMATGIMTFIFLFSAYNYFFNYEMIAGFYDKLGFPRWIIYPSGTLKILALVAIYSNLSSVLKEWAYAGLFFVAVLAFTAHYMAGGGGEFAGVAIVAVLVSRFFNGRLFPRHY